MYPGFSCAAKQLSSSFEQHDTISSIEFMIRIPSVEMRVLFGLESFALNFSGVSIYFSSVWRHVHLVIMKVPQIGRWVQELVGFDNNQTTDR